MPATGTQRAMASEAGLMGSALIPWTQAAVLVRDLGGGERRVAGEGTLYAMVHRLNAIDRRQWDAYLISLPDRPVAPFGYVADEFDDLIRASERARL